MQKVSSLKTVQTVGIFLSALAIWNALGCAKGVNGEGNCASGSELPCTCANGQPGMQPCFDGTYADCQCEASSGAAGIITASGVYAGGGGVIASGAAGAIGGRTAAIGGNKATGAAGARIITFTGAAGTKSKTSTGTGGVKNSWAIGGKEAVDKINRTVRTCPKGFTCIVEPQMNILMISGQYCADPAKPDPQYGVIPPTCGGDDDCELAGLPYTMCQNIMGLTRICLMYCTP